MIGAVTSVCASRTFKIFRFFVTVKFKFYETVLHVTSL